ncbi:MAG: hypothetical protein EXS39_04815 [Opitutaceae bacterium]|nr:hypothetical protein [Opitutaceae bacterium]
MSATPNDPKPAGDERPPAAAGAKHPELTFGDKLHLVWKNHGSLITTGCVIILLAILTKGGWEFYAAQREAGIESGYAAAGTPDKLKAFAGANAGHALAGLAHLRLADDAYTAGKFADALTGYAQAAAMLKSGPFAARAQLGGAMSKLGSGRTAEGEAALKQFSADTTQLKGIRVEATYQLASLAADAGRPAEVVKFSDQLMQIDPASPWTQRALMLRASQPVTAATTKQAPASPSIQLKPPGKP